MNEKKLKKNKKELISRFDFKSKDEFVKELNHYLDSQDYEFNSFLNKWETKDSFQELVLKTFTRILQRIWVF